MRTRRGHDVVGAETLDHSTFGRLHDVEGFHRQNRDHDQSDDQADTLLTGAAGGTAALAAIAATTTLAAEQATHLFL